MGPHNFQGQFTGFHFRPATGPDAQFNQRTVAAVVVPVLGYGIMAVFSPNQIGVPIWAGVALFVIPAICGLIVHSIGEVVTTRRKMLRAACVAFVCFFIYAIVNMSIIHDRIHSSSLGIGPIVAMLMAAVGDGIVVAAVSGIMAGLPVHHVETHW